MHDCAIPSKFTMKPPVQEFFSNLWHFHIVFKIVFFLSLLLEYLSKTKFAICIYKGRFDGEFCLTDVIMHKSYFTVFFTVNCFI